MNINLPNLPNLPKLPKGLKEALGQFGPLAAIAVALAVFVAAVPSTTPTRDTNRLTADDLGAGSDVTDAEFGPQEGAAPAEGAVAAADGSPAAAGGGGARAGAAGAARGSLAASNPALYKGEDCTRRAIMGEDYPCKPIWVGGDNGGATNRGVTKDKLRIVVYSPKGNEQVDAILKQAGVADPEANKRAVQVHNRWFNKNYELYGRQLEVIVMRGPGDATPAQQQADAITIAEETKAFAMVCASCTPYVHQELARRGVLNMTSILPMTKKFLEEGAPYTYSILPETDTLFAHFAEYWCKRLNGGKADWAGPGVQGQDRKLGVIFIESDLANLGSDISGALERECNIKPHKVVGYPPDITRAAEIATNVIAQMRTSGATSVTCVCDPVAPLFFTTEATKQAYFPEWIHNGMWGTDSDIAGRNYDQQQWQRSFGPSSISYYTPLAQLGNWKSYWQEMGDNGVYGDAVADPLEFLMLSVILRYVEEGGPKITYQGVIRGLLNGPPNASTPQPWGGFEVSSSFGREPGKYTAIDDFMEIWWNINGEAPHGLYPAGRNRGYLYYVNGGKRYRAGEWPRGKPNVFVNDGSRQPGPDPDARCKCRQTK